jgi:hypothetical protein
MVKAGGQKPPALVGGAVTPFAHRPLETPVGPSAAKRTLNGQNSPRDS